MESQFTISKTLMKLSATQNPHEILMFVFYIIFTVTVSIVNNRAGVNRKVGCPNINLSFLKFCSFKSEPPIVTPKTYFVRIDL